MTPLLLTPNQVDVIALPANRRIFLHGPAGCGKTTTGVERMLALLRAGIPAQSILVLVPQRTLGEPYQAALREEFDQAGGQVTLLTVGGIARRMVELFWPLVAENAGFARPDSPPSFLTLETALYYMAHLVRPKMDEGLFDSVTIERNRIYSQVIDNLNKAALVGFPYTEIGARLKAAWIEDTAQGHIYEDAQYCATLFREYCLFNNLLDFSLQIEVFRDTLWPSLLCREYLQHTYRHLIYDNAEEDNPLAHELIRQWLPEFDSALIICDQDAGYRRFLGAHPNTALELCDACDDEAELRESFIANPVIEAFCGQIGMALDRPSALMRAQAPPNRLADALHYPETPLRFYPQMLDWVAGEVDRLIREGTPAGEIVLLAPMLPDSLRFALTDRLEVRGIPVRSHRPSRSLREEPAAQAMLTLAMLAHPEWALRPSSFEVAYALIQVIDGLDLVRAQLLVDAVLRVQGPVGAGGIGLLPFEKIRADMQERVTYSVGMRYDDLRRWLEEYSGNLEVEPGAPDALDYFFSRLFGEVLSQPGYAFHENTFAGTVAANLVESARKFRWAVEERQPAPDNLDAEEPPLGKEYVRMIQEGVLAAQYIESWQIPPENAVLLAPAYTFLLANQPVDHQFWLDIGASSWSQRLYQPLTHPYVLSQNWEEGRVWTDVDEYEWSRENLYCLVLGLARRCRKQIHLGLCDLGESGYEQRGMLLKAIQQVLKQALGHIQQAGANNGRQERVR